MRTCDGEFFTGKDVIVVGGGFAAAEESVFLTRFARKVTLLVREDDFTCDAMVHRRPRTTRTSRFTMAPSSSGCRPVSKDSTGPCGVRSPPVRKPLAARRWSTFGVFVFAGYVPQTAVVKGVVDLDPQGYVIADEHMQTSRPAYSPQAIFG